MLLWDGYGLQSTHSGIGRHALELAQALESLGQAPTIIPSVSALDPEFLKWKADLAHFPLSRVKPLALFAAGIQARAIMNSSASKSALFHGLSNYNLPVLPKTFRKVLTVHDLIPFIFPEGVSRKLHRYLSYQMPKALDRADAIVCVSHWTAGSIKNQFPSVQDKVLVIPNGKPKPRPSIARGSSHKLRLLSVSRGESYKRLSLIPQIIKLLPNDFEWHLVTDGKGRSQLEANEKIFLHQSISDPALDELFGNTDIFVHPSLWEGYCLPAVTALSFGVPAVFCGGSGIDEVIAEAGIKLSPTAGPEEWASAIETVARERSGFGFRADSQFEKLPSWQQVAGQLKELYASMS